VLVFGRSFFDSVDNECRFGIEMRMSTTSETLILLTFWEHKFQGCTKTWYAENGAKSFFWSDQTLVGQSIARTLGLMSATMNWCIANGLLSGCCHDFRSHPQNHEAVTPVAVVGVAEAAMRWNFGG